MTEDRGEIKIRCTLKQEKEDALSSETVHVFPISGWKISLILVPTFMVLAFLSAFFFSIFFSLFLFGGAILGLWIWWLRRKLLKFNPAQSLEGKHVLINETYIVETKTDKVDDK